MEGEIKTCVSFLKTNALLCVHDVLVPSYAISRMDWTETVPGMEAVALPFNYGLWVARNKAFSPHGSLDDAWIKKPDTGGA